MTTPVYPTAIDGYFSLPILIDLVSPVRAADVNRLRNAIIAIERELGINPSGTYGTVRARLDAMELGVSSGGAGESSAGTGEDFISGLIEAPTDKTYTITSEIPYDGYIHSITAVSGAGSCTLTTTINGVAVGGSANSVSTTESTEFTSAPNSFVVGDTIAIDVSGTSSCTDLSFTILIFVTPGGQFGEANDGVNVGVGGVGVFKQKVGLNLQFRNVNATSNRVSVALDTPNNEIDIDVVESNILINNLSGVLGITKGGTGQATATAAFDALSPTTTKGDLIVRNNTTNTRIASGPDGYILIADSSQSTGLRWGTASFIGANTALSNLASTSINQSLIPGSDDLLDLGSASLRWRDLYLGPTSLKFITTVGETGSARNWKVGVRESAGTTQGSLIVQEGSTEFLCITPTGNVGIGITDPASILEIDGTFTLKAQGSPPPVAPSGTGRIYFDNSTSKLRFSENGGSYSDFGSGGGGGSGANTSLSNLTSTMINTSLIPGSDDGYDLGLSSARWRDLYVGPTSIHIVSTAGETGTARDWRLAIAEAVGNTRGRFRILEGSTEYFSITATGAVGIGTTDPNGILQLGSTSSNFSYIQNNLNTTNASVNTLNVLQTTNDKTYFVESRITARRTGGSSGTTNDHAAFLIRASYINNGGTLSLTDITTEYTSRNQSAWSATLTTSGTNIALSITGATNNNISWASTTTVSII